MNLDLIYFIVGLSWLISYIILSSRVLKNRSKMRQLKALLGFSFRWKDGILVWKEVFKPSKRDDKDYMLLINVVRITSLLVLIIVTYWIFGI